jgi:hypothetical protein
MGNSFQKANFFPFVLDCMDAGGRATHGAVAESMSKDERKKVYDTTNGGKY